MPKAYQTLTINCDLLKIPAEASDKFIKNGLLDAKPFIKSLGFPPHPAWMIYQAENILAPYCTVPSVKQTIAKIKDSYSNPGVKLAYRILCRSNRSAYFDKPDGDALNYSKAVPALPGVAKRFHGIPYKDWDFTQCEEKDNLQVVGHVFADLMPYNGLHKQYHDQWGSERLLEFRAIHSVEDYRLIGKTGDYAFDVLKADFRRLLLRKWIWKGESEYMVHNLDNWDAEPYLKILEDKLLLGGRRVGFESPETASKVDPLADFA